MGYLFSFFFVFHREQLVSLFFCVRIGTGRYLETSPFIAMSQFTKGVLLVFRCLYKHILFLQPPTILLLDGRATQATLSYLLIFLCIKRDEKKQLWLKRRHPLSPLLTMLQYCIILLYNVTYFHFILTFLWKCFSNFPVALKQAWNCLISLALFFYTNNTSYS